VRAHTYNTCSQLGCALGVKIPKNRYESIDWADLWRRLYLHAAKLTGGVNTVIDCGVSAEDLVQDTMKKFLQSPNGLGWRENKGSLPVFLGAILENGFIDHIRREKKVVRPDPGADEPAQPTPDQPSLIEDLALQQFQNRLLTLIKGREDERELKDFILASSMTTSEGKVNKQLADLLGVDEGEVINRRKKLWRVADVKELYEEFRDGRKPNKSAN
jgi:DNA-directed RNA polymerase specialized sigma24 family protein